MTMLEVSKTPAVSICIPSYNQPNFVERTIESIFSQTFSNFEIIVADDSTEDSVQEVCKRWSNDSRFSYHRNTVRLGSPENWNECLRLCRAELVKFMHHDDWFATHDSLACFVKAMQDHPEINFAFSATRACEDDGTLMHLNRPTLNAIESLKREVWSLQFANIVGAPSATIFRKRIDIFDQRLQWVVDVDSYLEILEKNSSFYYIDKPLVCTSANALHQITRTMLSDNISRCWEHLYLYSKRPPPLNGRFRGLKFILGMLGALDRDQIAELFNRRAKELSAPEEFLAFKIGSIRIKVRCCVQIVKKLVSKCFIRFRRDVKKTKR